MNGENCEKLLRSFPRQHTGERDNLNERDAEAPHICASTDCCQTVACLPVFAEAFIAKSIDGSDIQKIILISNITFTYQTTADALLFNIHTLPSSIMVNSVSQAFNFMLQAPRNNLVALSLLFQRQINSLPL